MANAKKQPIGADLTPQQVDDASSVSERAAGRVPIGILARDTRRDKVGRVMGHLGPYVQMRPPNGGCEWDARPEDVQLISASESLSNRVAEANAWSRRGLA
jgi:hypothetical protein